LVTAKRFPKVLPLMAGIIHDGFVRVQRGLRKVGS